MDSIQLHNLIRAIKVADLGAIDQLCKSGVDLNQLTQNGQTPLSIAAISGNTRVLRALIDAGANVNIATGIGFTPLTWAVWAKKRKAATLLRSVGAKDETGNVMTKFDQQREPEGTS